MTVFADTWNSAYEGIPADNENISLGANRIRDFKVNVRQRIAVDHSFNGDANDGYHIHSTYIPQVNDFAPLPPFGFVYTKTLNTNITELFYEDNLGDVTQLTRGGVVNTQPFPSGTSMIFVQPSPPVGWVQQTNVNDQLLRFVNDNVSGGNVGGSWTIGGTTVSTSVSTSTSTSTTTVLNSLALATIVDSVAMSISINPVTLSAANLPSHQHNVTAAFNAAGTGIATSSGGTSISNTGLTTDGGIGLNGTSFTPTGSASFVSGSAHTNVGASTLTSTSISSSSSPASSSFSNDGTWRPAYVNVIRANKS